jgi:hypothetical protein
MLGFVATDRSHQMLLTFFDEEARLFTVSEAMGDPFACLQIAHSGHRLQAIKNFQGRSNAFAPHGGLRMLKFVKLPEPSRR